MENAEHTSVKDGARVVGERLCWGQFCAASSSNQIKRISSDECQLTSADLLPWIRLLWICELITRSFHL